MMSASAPGAPLPAASPSKVAAGRASPGPVRHAPEDPLAVAPRWCGDINACGKMARLTNAAVGGAAGSSSASEGIWHRWRVPAHDTHPPRCLL